MQKLGAQNFQIAQSARSGAPAHGLVEVQNKVREIDTHGPLDQSLVLSTYSSLMAALHRIAPIFPVRDLTASLAHYSLLGFTTRPYEGGGYGFATLDGVEIHLGTADDTASSAAAYLFVDDADDLARTWQSAGVTVHPPQDTEWGQHEGAVVDPDGNVIRFGSPMKPSSG